MGNAVFWKYELEWRDRRRNEWNDVGLPMCNVVFWMYEVRWGASERIGEGNGVGLPKDLPVGKQLECRGEGWQCGPPDMDAASV